MGAGVAAAVNTAIKSTAAVGIICDSSSDRQSFARTRRSYFSEWTYAARFGNAPIWKIGKCTDLHRRLTELNVHVPVEWLEQEWRLELQQAWRDTKTALRMEQAVLDILSTHPIEGERVRCTQDELTSAWVQALGSIHAQSDGG